MADQWRILALAQHLLPPGIGVGTADPRADFPAEPGGPLRATPARLREFAAGRRASRGAMRAIGMAEQMVPMGADRAPIWPPGLCGSIAHSACACVAAVAPTLLINALGIDLEPDRSLPPDLVQLICLPDEQAWLDAQSATARGPLGTLIFSAKEAAYKAQYPLTGALFGYDALRVDIRPADFTATFLRPVGRFSAGERLSGRWARGDGHFMTVIAACIPQRTEQ